MRKEALWKSGESPRALEKQTVTGQHFRITVLTGRLLRFEYLKQEVPASDAGQAGKDVPAFLDEATQTVLNRRLGEAGFTLTEKDGQMFLRTEAVTVTYDGGPFSAAGLQVAMNGKVCNFGAIWRYGEKPDTLGGTARTLDGVCGRCELSAGICSYTGITVLDDSHSLILQEDGRVSPRQWQEEDFYVFAYGHAYRECLQDFYRLTGRTPLLPRFALGNWWSRYYRYEEKQYRALMEHFQREGVPLAVAVLDMDWHITDPDPQYGSGWTGYTWNRQLFPRPEQFLAWLHGMGLRVTLNDHPADGIRPFEDCYPAAAEALSLDPEKGETIPCDLTDPRLVQVWFEQVLRPLEEQGVDFWWVDWQQGQCSRIPGLDPLWLQNHLRYLEGERKGRRGLLLSRYAGPGSHRYPVGFSGDTIISWDSLRFQPYFTATASNIGFGWWSHDIGGHMLGYRDEELAGRWLQLGVFSPICRLHSSNSEFSGKEPWNYRWDVCEMMKRFLRLRHQLVPYLYTMNYRCYREGLPLIEPMYYRYPENQEAYQVPNQYYFGSDLLAAPITEPCHKKTHRAAVTVWLPPGDWYDFFTGRHYRGGEKLVMYRSLDSFPVLAAAGSILPLVSEREVCGTEICEADGCGAEICGTETCETDSCGVEICEAEACGAEAARRQFGDLSVNPVRLQLVIYTGANGSFELYEDDNETLAYEQGTGALTGFTWKEWISPADGKLFRTGELHILPVKGEKKLVPERRDYEISFVGAKTADTGKVIRRSGEKETEAETEPVPFHEVQACRGRFLLEGVKPEEELFLMVELSDREKEKKREDFLKEIFQFLHQAECDYEQKEQIYAAASRLAFQEACWEKEFMKALHGLHCPEEILGCILELL